MLEALDRGIHGYFPFSHSGRLRRDRLDDWLTDELDEAIDEILDDFEGFDEFLPASQMSRAVQRNQVLSSQLGWQSHYQAIARFLAATGCLRPNYSTGWQDLSAAIACWQQRQGLTADGIIGRDTWRRLQIALGIIGQSPATPSVSPSTRPLTPARSTPSGLHLTGRVGSKIVNFYVYAQIPDLERRIQTILSNLERLPPGHIDVIDPIFIVNRFPGGRTTGGGYWSPGAVRNQWLGRFNATGVPDEDIQAYVLSQPNTGIVGITKAAFLRDIYLFTIFHELAHSVDYHLGIVPAGSTVDHFRGVHYPSKNVNEYAAEAYARFILVPSRICRTGNIPVGENSNTCSQRLINVLMESPAFRRVPRYWRPSN